MFPVLYFLLVLGWAFFAFGQYHTVVSPDPKTVMNITTGSTLAIQWDFDDALQGDNGTMSIMLWESNRQDDTETGSTNDRPVLIIAYEIDPRQETFEWDVPTSRPSLTGVYGVVLFDNQDPGTFSHSSLFQIYGPSKPPLSTPNLTPSAGSFFSDIKEDSEAPLAPGFLGSPTSLALITVAGILFIVAFIFLCCCCRSRKKLAVKMRESDANQEIALNISRVSAQGIITPPPGAHLALGEKRPIKAGGRKAGKKARGR